MDPRRTSPFRLDGALAVVVGGNQGIGAAIALGLAENGCRIVLAARDTERLEETRREVERITAAAVDTRVVDITSIESIDEFSTAVVKDRGTPTVLINSAGGALYRPILEVTTEDWDTLINTHLRGTFFMCQAFGRHMVEVGYGKIVNMSSTWASTTAPGRSVYATAKAGVSHLTASMAVEWATSNVCVNAIAPTATVTPRVARLYAQEPDQFERARARIPMGRLATPEDVVGAALFLSSPLSDFVTGHTLYVDGGWHHSK
jgi:NAD(P)-dependent dehydrogenase (short-subunit alcohol dehydrogenase family)